MATTVSFFPLLCRFRVVNAIRYENLVQGLPDSTLGTTTKSWDKGTDKVWNRGAPCQPWGQCFIQVANESEIGPMAPGFHLIQVKGGDPFNAVTWFGPGSTMGLWHIQTHWKVAAHEVGHLMGLGEEYHYDANGVYVNDNPQPVDPQSIMAQTWGDVAGLPSHYDKILAQFNAACPEDCKVSVLARIPEFILPPFRRRPPPFITGIPVIPRDVRPGSPRPPLPPRNPLEGRAIDEIFAKIESGAPHEMALGVDALAAQGAAASPALIQYLNHSHVLRRWACATALGRIGDQSAVAGLQAALQDPHSSVRLAAAVSLLQLRDKSGVQTLITALMSNDVMIGHPPRLAREHAHIALRHWTGQDFGYDSEASEADRVKAAARWQTWWDGAGPTFRVR